MLFRRSILPDGGLLMQGLLNGSNCRTIMQVAPRAGSAASPVLKLFSLYFFHSFLAPFFCNGMVYLAYTKFLQQAGRHIMQIYESIQEDGTFDLSIEMNKGDIECFCDALKYLKDNDNWHFHIVNNFNGNKNKLCNIEISYNSTAGNDFEALISPAIHYSKDNSKKP